MRKHEPNIDQLDSFRTPDAPSRRSFRPFWRSHSRPFFGNVCRAAARADDSEKGKEIQIRVSFGPELSRKQLDGRIARHALDRLTPRTSPVSRSLKARLPSRSSGSTWMA